MNTIPNHHSHLLLRLCHIGLIAACVLMPAIAAPSAVSLSSQFLVRGEQAVLEYVLPEGVSRQAKIEVPKVKNLSIRSVRQGVGPRLGFGRQREFVFTYSVTGYEPGNYTIPPAEIIDGQETYETDPIDLQVIHETELDWSTADAGSRRVPYAAAFYTSKQNPYVKETIPVELKLYLPTDQRVEDWGIPDFERDGVAAWRFEPRPAIGRVNLRGDRFYAISYPSTLAPTRSGDVRIGPAKLRLITIQSSARNFGQAFYQPLNLKIPELKLDSRPLPPDQPEGFNQAVGQFNLTATADETEIREGDPVSVTLTLTGRGNFDAISAPEPLNAETWKLYPPSRSETKRDQRRSIRGNLIFKQFLRPLEPTPKIPPFRLVYFDPKKEAYQTIFTEAIPLTITPSTQSSIIGAAPPAAAATPVEKMTDILSPIQASSWIRTPGSNFLTRWWQLIPLAIALILFARILSQWIHKHWQPDPDKTARKHDLESLKKSGQNPVEFYRKAGQIVETWITPSNDPVARDILEKRDQTCFRPDANPSDLEPDDRRRILRSLRKLVLPAILIAACGMTSLRADDQTNPEPSADQRNALATTLVTSPTTADPLKLYEKGHYRQAAETWLNAAPYPELSADALYNIGNASYRLGQPGEAALYWRRALLRDATHPEARQNLRFLERKFGSISYEYEPYQKIIAKIPLPAWTNIAALGGWLIVIGCLIFPATRRGARLRLAAIAALIIAPCLIASGLAGWYYFPDDARFASPRQQGVVIADRATIRTAAAHTAPEVIDAPAGSLCRILNHRGNWSYIAFTNDIRGWISNRALARLIPRTKPTPPTAPKIDPDSSQNT